MEKHGESVLQSRLLEQVNVAGRVVCTGDLLRAFFPGSCSRSGIVVVEKDCTHVLKKSQNQNSSRWWNLIVWTIRQYSLAFKWSGIGTASIFHGSSRRLAQVSQLPDFFMTVAGEWRINRSVRSCLMLGIRLGGDVPRSNLGFAIRRQHQVIVIIATDCWFYQRGLLVQW